MKLVDDYVNSSVHKELLQKLRSLLLSHSLLKEEFKWSMPVYTKSSKDVCYIKSTKNGVNIGFTKGSALSDASSLLEGTGKDMRHIKLHSVEALEENSSEINSLISQALNFEQ